MDPHAVLGLPAGSSPEEIAAAYRRQAKRWHPDVAGADRDAQRRMANVNAAYELLRDTMIPGARGPMPGGTSSGSRSGAPSAGAGAAPDVQPGAASGMTDEAPTDTGAGASGSHGAWLAEPVRRALGPELLVALQHREPVVMVTSTSTAGSPARLVLTDRRLLWLMDDVVGTRVRSLRLRDLDHVDTRLRWPRRKVADLRVLARGGRRHGFGDLRPETAARLQRWLVAAASAPRT